MHKTRASIEVIAACSLKEYTLCIAFSSFLILLVVMLQASCFWAFDLCGSNIECSECSISESHTPASAYPAPDATHSKFSYFPHLPQRHGLGSYKADKHCQTVNDKKCCKYSYGYPTLTPGIFMLYCLDGVCYGFEVLRSCESLRHPFQFTTRFTSPPFSDHVWQHIQLHIYALNREPQQFKMTRFVVDCLHGHGRGVLKWLYPQHVQHTQGLQFTN